MSLSKEDYDMYNLVIRALEHYRSKREELSKTLPSEDDFTIPDNIGKIISDDLTSELNHINSLIRDITSFKDSIIDCSRLPALIKSRQDLVKISIESYAHYLKKSKELVQTSLNVSTLKLEALDEEIDLAEKASKKYC